MSYGQIFRRISRLFQSSVNSMLSDADKEQERAFDEELRQAEEARRGPDENTKQRGQQQQRREQSQSTSSGQRKPGERDDAFYLAILGLTPSATNDEVRKAYRMLMAQYHPDRVATLGPELQKTAADKSKEINEAFMIIERRRGMK